MSISVKATSCRKEISLEQLLSDYAKIASYDGTVVEIQVCRESSIPSVMLPGSSLDAAMSQVLAEADAATSPHYTAAPRGQPFQTRVAAARNAYRRQGEAFLAEALLRSTPRACSSRDEALHANWNTLNATFRLSRGGYLDSEFRKMVMRQMT